MGNILLSEAVDETFNAESSTEIKALTSKAYFTVNSSADIT